MTRRAAWQDCRATQGGRQPRVLPGPAVHECLLIVTQLKLGGRQARAQRMPASVDLDASDDAGGWGWDVDVDPVARLRDRARRVLGAWTRADGHEVISIAGRPLPASILTSTGAIEVAVHGWDVARACGQHRPIPPLLAQELLEVAPLLVTQADRPARFAAPVRVSRLASPSERLIAYLGRDPRER